MKEFTLLPGGAVARPRRTWSLSALHLPLRRDLPPCDPSLLLTILALTLLGLPLLYSASYAVGIAQYRNHLHFVLHQSFCVAIGLGLMAMISRWDMTDLRARTPYVYLASFALLVLVLLVGARSGDVHVSRWLRWGPISFQPSECAKFACLLMIAYLASAVGPGMFRHWADWLLVEMVIVPVLLLVVIEPHLSATLLIAGTSATMCFVAGARARSFVYFALFGVVFLTSVYGVTRLIPPARDRFDYIIQRVQGHRGETQNPQDSQYQPRHSAAALKRGGLFGVGFCQGRAKLLYLPAPQNDFIFAVIGEEWGLVGALALLAVYAWLILKCCEVAAMTDHQFASLACVGVASLIALQVAVNVAVATAIIPTTGVALPFVSSGGSGLVMLLCAMGVVLNASRTMSTAALYGERSRTVWRP